MDLMPAGMGGAQAQNLNSLLNKFIDSGRESAQILASLQNIQLASGGNLRRIGSNLGFSFATENDDDYRQFLLGYIALKNCTGSLDSLYDALRIFSIDISRVDIYNVFDFTSGLRFDATWLLNATRTLDANSEKTNFYTNADFHRENGDVFLGGDQIIEYCRPPTRVISCREVFELDPQNADTNFSGTLEFDATWTLDATRMLDPFRSGAKCKLLNNGALVEEVDVSQISYRIKGREWVFTTTNLFNEIQIWDLTEQMASFSLPTPTRFYFEKKIVSWRYTD